MAFALLMAPAGLRRAYRGRAVLAGFVAGAFAGSRLGPLLLPGRLRLPVRAAVRADGRRARRARDRRRPRGLGVPAPQAGDPGPGRAGRGWRGAERRSRSGCLDGGRGRAADSAGPRDLRRASSARRSCAGSTTCFRRRRDPARAGSLRSLPEVDGPEGGCRRRRARSPATRDVRARAGGVVRCSDRLRARRRGIGLDRGAGRGGDQRARRRRRGRHGVQLRGAGPKLRAQRSRSTTNDIAVLRVDGLGAPRCRWPRTRRRAAAAILGFPRTAPTTSAPPASARRGSDHPGRVRPRPGDANDALAARPRAPRQLGRTAGRRARAVAGTVFAAAAGGRRHGGFGVPNRVVRQILAARGGTVDTACALCGLSYGARVSKTLVIAEKPSVGRDLARVLPGPFEKHSAGSARSARSRARALISWAVGHLVQLARPTSTTTSSEVAHGRLPIVPSKFKLVVRDERSQKQMSVVSS